MSLKYFFAAVMNILTLLRVIFTLQSFLTHSNISFFSLPHTPLLCTSLRCLQPAGRGQQWFEATVGPGVARRGSSSLRLLAFVHTINSFWEAYQDTHTLGASNTKNTF